MLVFVCPATIFICPIAPDVQPWKRDRWRKNHCNTHADTSKWNMFTHVVRSPLSPRVQCWGGALWKCEFRRNSDADTPHPDGINYCNVLKQPTCRSRINIELQGCGEQMSVGTCRVLIGRCCMHRCNECSAHRRIFAFLWGFLSTFGIVVIHEFKNCIVVIHELSWCISSVDLDHSRPSIGFLTHKSWDVDWTNHAFKHPVVVYFAMQTIFSPALPSTLDAVLLRLCGSCSRLSTIDLRVPDVSLSMSMLTIHAHLLHSCCVHLPYNNHTTTISWTRS